MSGGGAWVDVTKCPEYDIHKDPTEYCQVCHKKVGIGLDKCSKYLEDMDCPVCGEPVKAEKCHHCKGHK